MFIRIKLNNGSREVKYIVDFAPNWSHTIGHVAERIVEVCQIKNFSAAEL